MFGDYKFRHHIRRLSGRFYNFFSNGLLTFSWFIFPDVGRFCGNRDIVNCRHRFLHTATVLRRLHNGLRMISVFCGDVTSDENCSTYTLVNT